jgi:hypothetical protein
MLWGVLSGPIRAAIVINADGGLGQVLMAIVDRASDRPFFAMARHEKSDFIPIIISGILNIFLDL